MYSKVLVPFLLLIAVLDISASVLPAVIHHQDDELAWENDGDDFSDETEELARRVVTVDYRQNQCMPPIKDAFTIFDGATESCYYTPVFVTPLVMTEYLDCKSSSQKVLRDFSVQQLADCVFPLEPCGEFYPAFYDQRYVLSYLLFTGLTLTDDYNTAVQTAQNNLETATCVTSYTKPSYTLTRGYRTMSQLNESQMRRTVRRDGPILGTMHFKADEIYNLFQSPIARSGSNLGDYTGGVFDHDTFCVPSVKDPSYAEGDVLVPSRLYSEGYQVPVMIVGFTKYESVPVWIVRSDWFGANWGMNGYLYLRRGVNACNIALAPIRVLD